jgi:hypothetical protein
VERCRKFETLPFLDQPVDIFTQILPRTHDRKVGTTILPIKNITTLQMPPLEKYRFVLMERCRKFETLPFLSSFISLRDFFRERTTNIKSATH